MRPGGSFLQNFDGLSGFDGMNQFELGSGGNFF